MIETEQVCRRRHIWKSREEKQNLNLNFFLSVEMETCFGLFKDQG